MKNRGFHFAIIIVTVIILSVTWNSLLMSDDVNVYNNNDTNIDDGYGNNDITGDNNETVKDEPDIENEDEDGFLLDLSKRYTFDMLENDLVYLDENYSDFVSVSAQGTSLLGKNIYLMKVGTGSVPVFVQAGLHAREIANTPLVMQMVYDLLQSDDVILKQVTFFIVPLANPDGYEISYKGIGDIKDSNIAFDGIFEDWKYLKSFVDGVDGNRNWPSKNWGFEDEWGTKLATNVEDGPYYKNYAGTHPLANPEMKTLRKIADMENYLFALDIHSKGRVIYATKPDLSDTFNDKVLEYAILISKITGYGINTSEKVRNGTDGTTTDYFSERGIPCFTIETLAMSDLYPVMPPEIEKEYNKVKNLLLYIGRKAAWEDYNEKDIVSFDYKYSKESRIEDIVELKKRYASSFDYKIEGKSIDGRDIYSIELGNGPKHIFIQVGIHARETGNTPMIMKMIETMLKEKNSLLEKLTYVIIPLANPDGFELATRGVHIINDKSFITDEMIEKYNRWKSFVNNRNGNRHWPTPDEEITDDVPIELVIIKDIADRYEYELAVDIHSRGKMVYYGKPYMGYTYNNGLYNFLYSITRELDYELNFNQPREYGFDGTMTDYFAYKDIYTFTIETFDYNNDEGYPINMDEVKKEYEIFKDFLKYIGSKIIN